MNDILKLFLYPVILGLVIAIIAEIVVIIVTKERR